jgi:hypothetical protein
MVIKIISILIYIIFSALPANAENPDLENLNNILKNSEFQEITPVPFSSHPFPTAIPSVTSKDPKADASGEHTVVSPIPGFSDIDFNVAKGKIEIPGVNSTLEFAVQFRQTEYKLPDLQSDVSLLVYTKAIPKKLFKVLFGSDNASHPGANIYGELNPVIEDSVSSAPQLPTEQEIMSLNIPKQEKERMLVQLRNSKLMIEGRNNPIKIKEMVKMFTQIISEETANGITPKYGRVHAWSPEFLKLCEEKGESIPLTFSKLLTALSSGVTARHMKTGKETDLINFILSRPNKSLFLHEIFIQSYRLNDGDVYQSILTPLNILSDAWRHPQRDKLAMTGKLSKITNVYNGEGDKFGSWYHFLGIMLYGYVKGGLKSTVVGNIESIGSHMLGEGQEYQEDHINSKGGRVGARLAKIIREQSYKNFVPDKNYCDVNVYLNLNEDFRDRTEIINSKDFETTLSFETLWIKSLDKDYLNCKVEVIYNDHTGELNSRYKIVRKDVSILKGKTFSVGITSNNPVSKARAFITNCSNQPDTAVEDSDPFAGHNQN